MKVSSVVDVDRRKNPACFLIEFDENLFQSSFLQGNKSFWIFKNV
jgi:hypothetical protein